VNQRSLELSALQSCDKLFGLTVGQVSTVSTKDMTKPGQEVACKGPLETEPKTKAAEGFAMLLLSRSRRQSKVKGDSEPKDLECIGRE
jgi:hypothetical protein